MFTRPYWLWVAHTTFRAINKPNMVSYTRHALPVSYLHWLLSPQGSFCIICLRVCLLPGMKLPISYAGAGCVRGRSVRGSILGLGSGRQMRCHLSTFLAGLVSMQLHSIRRIKAAIGVAHATCGASDTPDHTLSVGGRRSEAG
jgi:hypothetical protein